MDKVQEIMELLGCDEQTARQVVEDDQAIDKGAKLFEQTAEQKANSKKYRQGDRKKPIVLTKRERKADLDKRKLVEMLAASVNLVADNEPTVTNAERQIDFVYNGRKFRVVLSAPRS